MKKLALALVCLVSVAFFASCDRTIENPEPSIAVIAEEGYIQNNDIIDVNTDYSFGFIVASNAETNKELANLLVNVEIFDVEGNSIGLTEWDNLDLTGMTSYPYRETLTIEYGRDEIVGTCVITAKVTDAAGEINTATINLSINNPAQQLIARTFEWYRLGNTITGLEEFGLWWDRNLKATHAQIKPLVGAKLFIFDAEDWEATATDLDKAALFNAAVENNEAVTLYDGINTDVAGDKDYDEVIGSITEDGDMYLIHITHYNRGAFVDQGYPFTITGEAK